MDRRVTYKQWLTKREELAGDRRLNKPERVSEGMALLRAGKNFTIAEFQRPEFIKKEIEEAGGILALGGNVDPSKIALASQVVLDNCSKGPIAFVYQNLERRPQDPTTRLHFVSVGDSSMGTRYAIDQLLQHEQTILANAQRFKDQDPTEEEILQAVGRLNLQTRLALNLTQAKEMLTDGTGAAYLRFIARSGDFDTDLPSFVNSHYIQFGIKSTADYYSAVYPSI